MVTSRKSRRWYVRPGSSRESGGKAVYKQQATGEGEIFRDRKKTRVRCTKCGVTVKAPHIDRKSVVWCLKLY